ncbi:o-succinylbenzoate synthase [Providencia rettgeri]|uniref:o-succinylbenzoate synthase n=1 Tax=Providencia rettgeri TaxID=587 RepID=UPI0034E07F72
MRKAKIYSFSLPMEAGVILRYQRLKTRDGLLVCLQEGDNEGWGEISPLPEFSQETLEEATAETIIRLNEWVKYGKISDSQLPSVAFGCSCAVAELAGELPKEADYRKAPLCSGDPDDLILSLDAMEGEKVAKVKVGLYEAVRDGMVVDLLLEAVPELKLRLDANRSWTRVKADGFAKYVNPDYRDRIAFLEEPCKTREDSLQFAADTGINIAWDESVREPDFKVEAQPGVVAIVIKPTLTGSLDYCRTLVEDAHRLGLQAVISSSIETSFGLTQLARVAHWLTPDTIPGLDTVSLIQSQLVRPWPKCSIPLQQLDDLTVIWHS